MCYHSIQKSWMDAIMSNTDMCYVRVACECAVFVFCSC